MVRMEKTKCGFNFFIGRLVIARAHWAKREGLWKVIIHRIKEGEERFGIGAASLVETYETPTHALDALTNEVLNTTVEKD